MSFVVVRFLKALLRLLFVFISGGEQCVVCGKTTWYYPLCRECRNNSFSIFYSFNAERCRKCGKELISANDVCLQCRETPVLVHTDSVWPLFSYRLWNKDLMFLWKSAGVRSLSDLFAQFMAEALKMRNVKVVVPVPPRPGKIQEKGWDQIDELCGQLKYRFGFTILPLLVRKTTGQQKKLDREERLKTIGKSYFLVGQKEVQKLLKPFKGEFPHRVCIIDDVCTTGSTLENCAQVLKEAGIKVVEAITLFSVD